MTQPYHRYVFAPEEGRVRGDFELMYRQEDVEGYDSWFQEDTTHLIRQLALAVLGRYNFDRILDVGCGKGTFTHLLKKQNNRVVGVDVSATAIAKARTKYPEIEFECADINATRVVIPDEFDLVVAMAVLYYIEPWRSVLADIASMTEYFLTTLYVPSDTMGSIASIEEFTSEAHQHFEPVTELVLDREKLLFFGRSRR